jgi:hypothetical protein
VVEDLGLAALSRRDQMLVQDLEDIVADLSKLRFDLLAVLLDQGDLGLVPLGLLLLLDGGDNPPRRASGTNDILVGDRKEIPLFDGELNIGSGNDLHVLDHFCRCQRCRLQSGRWRTFVALGLFGQLGQVDGIFVTHFEDLGKTKSVRPSQAFICTLHGLTWEMCADRPDATAGRQ